MITDIVNEHIQVINSIPSLIPNINLAYVFIQKALNNGNKILVCGNGGSAADAQHFVAELVGRFKSDKTFPAIALTTDTSILTAIGNDYGIEHIFSRQIEALGKEGDVLIALSTSGNSLNIIKAVDQAVTNKMKVILLLGGNGTLCSINSAITVNSHNTARVQEAHGLILHILAELIDQKD